MSDAPAWLVPEALDGERVDRAVALLTGLSRAHVSAAVQAGQVRVTGRAVRARGRRVRTGERLEVDREALVAPADATPAGDRTVVVPVVYEDAAVIVVDKPAGLVVHPGAGHKEGTLVHGLLARYPELASMDDPTRPGIVHRLDRGTSGLLVVARIEEARERLVAQLAARTVERGYTTLVWGTVEADEGLVDAPLGRADADPTRVAVQTGGRPARTRYEVRSRLVSPDGTGVTLLSCRLETGRTHQIRVHLASIGHPVVGDDRYGPRRSERRDRWTGLTAGRPFLHAGSLAFDHPISNRRLCFMSPLPADLEACLSRLSSPSALRNPALA